MKRKVGFTALAAMFLALVMTGCGGGGGGGEPPATAPAAPTGVTAAAGDNSASISWAAVAGATSYNIYHSTTTGVTKATGTKITGVTSPSIVTGLVNGTPHFFVVTAVNAVGESADSSQVSATPTLAAPAAPTGVTATAGENSATIGWSAVAGATSYNIYYSTTPGVTTAGNKLTGRVSPSIVTGLTNVTAYYFVVTAVNAAGEGPVSSEVSATPTAAPAPAPPAGATATAGPHEVTVSWSAVTGATLYTIYFDNTTPVTKAAPNKVTGIANSPRIITGLANGTTYYFRVTALNANGESDLSNEASAVPNPFPALPAPTGVVATPGPGQVTVNWSAVTGATSYNIYHSTTTGVTKATGTKVSGVTSPNIITGLIRGTPYFFVVTALNSDGVESPDSAQATATPNPADPTFASGDLTGTWNIRVILSGTSPGWYGVTATVDSSGNVTRSAPVGSATPPAALPGLSITAGTGVSAGVVTETGLGSNATFSGKISTGKNLIVGTSTGPDATTFAVHVFVKQVPGVTFSSADLANTTIAYNRIFSGSSHIWERGTGSINGSGQMSLSSVVDSNGAGILPAPTAITVNGTTGIVSIAAEPTFSGVMSPDKKIIVGASTDALGTYSLRVIQMRGQTYALADLAGDYRAISFHSDSVSSWAYATWSTDALGAVNVTNIVNSEGTPAAPFAFTQTIDSAGNVGTGMLSFGKDLFVSVDDFLDGSSITMKVQ